MSDDLPTVRVADVFVTANPEYTYVSRASKKLEDAVADHLEERDKLLLITGPSKTGKTVLVDHVVPQAMVSVVKIEGPMVATDADVWKQIVDDLGYFTEVGTEASRTETDTENIGANFGLNAGVLQAGVKGESGGSVGATAGKRRSASRSPQTVGREALLETGAALVIDDFHHIPPEVQTLLIKQLKSIVAQRKAPIILIAVPHHAADVVRAEPEMQGRLKHIEIPSWDEGELKQIALAGFAVLNVDCPDEIAEYLATVAWGSPHLMQILCRELAKANGIRETQQERVTLEPPSSWPDFLHDVAVENTDPKIHDKLATGAQSRSKRDPRPVQDGGTTDLYRALLTAISSTGPKRALTYDDLREALQSILVKLPQSNEVTSHLQKIHGIAKQEAGPGRDPVLEYDDKVLHVVDPFFAFRLRWGPSVLLIEKHQRSVPDLQESLPDFISAGELGIESGHNDAADPRP